MHELVHANNTNKHQSSASLVIWMENIMVTTNDQWGGKCFQINHEVIMWSTMLIHHYCDVIMAAMASQITSLTIVYSTVYSVLDQRKHQNSASLAFVWGIQWWPVNSSHKRQATRKMFPFDDVNLMAPSFQLAILPCWRSRLLRNWNHTGQQWVCL